MHQLRGRIILLAVSISAIFVGYTALFSGFYSQPFGEEHAFQEQGNADRPPLDIYLEVLNVDPIRQAIQIRLDFSTKTGPYGLHFPGSPDKDIVIQVSDGNDIQDVELQAKRPANSKTLQLDVRGAIGNYPLDRYDGAFWIKSFEGSAQAEGAPVPIRLTIWEEIAGWDITTSIRPRAPGESGMPLNIEAQRPHSHIFFAFVVFAAMVLIAAGGLTIGVLVFLRIRKIEAALTGALAAMVFAVPALRNVLPGAPPLGIRADAFVFLWVEVALIVGLTLFIAAWARHGPPP